MARFCLPTWHTTFAHLSTGHKRPKIASGCYVSGGNVQCDPEAMRTVAETKMRKLGYWNQRKLPLTVYTAARYVASEVGSGPPEEKVAVLEAATNRVKLWRLRDVNHLLLYRQSSGHPNHGWYGPIHGPDGVHTAPYGRWAATSTDPGIDDILLADFVLAGKSKNFNQGAAGQYGMQYIDDPVSLVKKKAADSNYWVGPLPNVDHWHTFLFVPRPDAPPNSPQGQALLARGLAAVNDRRRPDWGGLRMCSSWKLPVPVFAGLALTGGLGLAYWLATYVEPTWRGHWLMGRQSRMLEQSHEQYRRRSRPLRRRR